jgi:hypothetical protein
MIVARYNSHGKPVLVTEAERTRRVRSYGELTRRQLELESKPVFDTTDCTCGLCGNFRAAEQLTNPPLGMSNEDLTWELVKSMIEDEVIGFASQFPSYK